MNQLIIEMCPSCESEAELLWDTDQDGYQAYCPYCGERLMLCSVCPATHDKEHCDYNSELDRCHRQSVTWAEYKARMYEEE